MPLSKEEISKLTCVLPQREKAFHYLIEGNVIESLEACFFVAEMFNFI
jgi:hypothetical protein